MIFGMLPIAIGMGGVGGFRAPTARAVTRGLITPVLLTLIVALVAYTYFDDFGGWVMRKLGGVTGAGLASPVYPVLDVASAAGDEADFRAGTGVGRVDRMNGCGSAAAPSTPSTPA